MAKKKKKKVAAEVVGSTSRESELFTHRALLKEKKFTRDHAHNIAKDVALSDKSDPFVYNRCFSSLMSGRSTPGDWWKLKQKGAEIAEKAEEAFNDLASTWEELRSKYSNLAL